MAPEEIENLLHATHQQKIAYVLEDEEEEGENGLKRMIESNAVIQVKAGG